MHVNYFRYSAYTLACAGETTALTIILSFTNGRSTAWVLYHECMSPVDLI